MVCSKVVNLSPEHLRPEVFTDELHYIQLILEAGRVPGQPRWTKHKHRHLIKVRMHVAQHLLLHIQYVSVHLPLNESLSHPEAHAFKDRHTNSSVLERRKVKLFIGSVDNKLLCVLMWFVLTKLQGYHVMVS